MHDALDGVGVVHGAYPGTETRVGEAVAKPGNGVDHHQDREGWMGRENGIGDDVAERCHDGNAALAELGVDRGIGERCERVAGEGGQKDQ